MIDQVTGAGALSFAVQLKALLDQEARYQPKLCGLRVIESAQDNGLRMTAKLRDFQVRDLLSLTRFFGFASETFSLAVSLLDRFLAVMKIQPKHLACVGLCCFYIAVKTSEEEKSVPLASDLIRISQNRFTVHDMMRMEKIILEKLYWKVKAPTALHFLRFFHSQIQEQLDAESRRTLNVERLEAQLKACHCCFTFTKLKVKAGDLVCVRELVAKCLAEYATTKCLKPNGQRLRWMISGRTARQLKHSYYKIAHLPTIPEYAC
ncbi:cyclin-G1 isoform X2 [Puntigrus tetrazona]|uniref:cyclin-G1 isoform X2 n=1 Tax=Puntigrus tetrazona TaxID=1606681 RepID=UPI001C8A0D6A|nr:cyclin-G1 isoform X2 [Puntigrus tetrazona]